MYRKSLQIFASLRQVSRYMQPFVSHVNGALIFHVSPLRVLLWLLTRLCPVREHIVQYLWHGLKPPLSGLCEVFPFDIFALTKMSLRLFDLLYATTLGLGKHRLNLGSSSIITLWCFLMVLDTEGKPG